MRIQAKPTCALLLIAVLELSQPLTHGASFVWTPPSGPNADVWARKQNWVEQGGKTQAVPGSSDEAVFTGSPSSLTPRVTGTADVGAIRFDPGSGSFNLAGASALLTLQGLSNVGLKNQNVTAAETLSVGTLALARSQTWINEGTLGISATTLSLGNDHTLTISGAGTTTIGAAVTGTGTSGLKMAGLGTLNLTGSSSYTGPINVSSGTLVVSNARGLGRTSGIDVSSGATFEFGSADPQFSAAAPSLKLAGGIFRANDRTAQFGPLNVTASSSIDLVPNAAQGDITFASATLVAGATLTVNNWTGLSDPETSDRIFISNQPDSAFLAGVQFAGFPKGAEWRSTGELVPVPEPAEFRQLVALTLIFVAGVRSLNSRKRA